MSSRNCRVLAAGHDLQGASGRVAEHQHRLLGASRWLCRRQRVLARVVARRPDVGREVQVADSCSAVARARRSPPTVAEASDASPASTGTAGSGRRRLAWPRSGRHLTDACSTPASARRRRCSPVDGADRTCCSSRVDRGRRLRRSRRPRTSGTPISSPRNCSTDGSGASGPAR